MVVLKLLVRYLNYIPYDDLVTYMCSHTVCLFYLSRSFHFVYVRDQFDCRIISCRVCCYLEGTSIDNDKKGEMPERPSNVRNKNKAKSRGFIFMKGTTQEIVRGWNQSGYVEKNCLCDNSGVLRIEPGDNGDSQDERRVGFACRADISLTPSPKVKCPPSSTNVITSPLLLLHRLEGLHQLHLILPPEGIALGHKRESRPGIRVHNAPGVKQWRQAESGRT